MSKALEKLYKERNKIEDEINKLEAAERLENIGKVLSSEFYAGLKAEGEEFLKEHKDLLKKEEFTINLPIRFTVKNDVKLDSVNDFIGDTLDADDFIEVLITAKIDGKASELNLTRLQYSLLQSGLDDVVYNACDRIIDLLPKELMQKVKDYKNRLCKFKQKVANLEDKHSINIEF